MDHIKKYRIFATETILTNLHKRIGDAINQAGLYGTVDQMIEFISKEFEFALHVFTTDLKKIDQFCHSSASVDKVQRTLKDDIWIQRELKKIQEEAYEAASKNQMEHPQVYTALPGIDIHQAEPSTAKEALEILEEIISVTKTLTGRLDKIEERLYKTNRA